MTTPAIAVSQVEALKNPEALLSPAGDQHVGEQACAYPETDPSDDARRRGTTAYPRGCLWRCTVEGKLSGSAALADAAGKPAPPAPTPSTPEIAAIGQIPCLGSLACASCTPASRQLS